MAKVALITGSALRLGRTITQHLASRGWDVALHFGTSKQAAEIVVEELQRSYPNQRFYAFQVDFNDLVQTQKLIKTVIEQFECLDLLINSASIFESGSLCETSAELLVRQTRVNYMAPFILMRDYANQATHGQIINITDTRIANNKFDHLSYSLSKKSLWELTKMAALELAPRFRVNAIAPGAALPPIGKDLKYLEEIGESTPMKIPSGVLPILKSIDYIIDNQDLTGQLLFCDGGAHLF